MRENVSCLFSFLLVWGFLLLLLLFCGVLRWNVHKRKKERAVSVSSSAQQAAQFPYLFSFVSVEKAF